MRGRPPKPEALRQRRNKVSTAATLPSQESARENVVPPLPARDEVAEHRPNDPKAGADGFVRWVPVWHPMVLEWWDSVWKSPMAQEFVDSDMRGGLYLLADLHQARWDARDNPKLLGTLAAEIRQQEVRFGLSPIDRSRLRWTIEQGETAADRTEARRAAKAPKLPKSKDPRDILKLA